MTDIKILKSEFQANPSDAMQRAKDANVVIIDDNDNRVLMVLVRQRKELEITREEFNSDPDRYILEADAGPVNIVDESGNIKMVLSSPKDE